jgi:hypothetical protein
LREVNIAGCKIMRYIIGFLITMGLLIFVFVLIFRGPSGGNNPAQNAPKKLIDYADTSIVMEFTIKGAVEADQTHDELRMTIGNNESTIEVFQGYQGNLIRTQSYANNPVAYADFLRALQLAGYNLGNPDKTLSDERGYCATGQRYIMEIKDGDHDIQRFWSSSCGIGSSKGKVNAIQSLFIRQIPDYSLQSRNLF